MRERPASLNLICGRTGCGSERDTGSGSYPELLCLRSGNSSVITWGLFDRRSRSPSVSFMLGPVRFPVQLHPETHWHSTPPPTPCDDVTQLPLFVALLLLRFLLLLLQVLMAVPNIIATYWPGVRNVSSPRTNTTPPQSLYYSLFWSVCYFVFFISLFE